MSALRYTALLLLLALSGCSMFESEASMQLHEPPPPKKKDSAWWKLGNSGPQDATASLEYQRMHSETDKSLVALVVRNTHLNKTIEGDMRTTIETGSNESKVDTIHFVLAPNDSKKVLVYPASIHMTYEVTAFFKE
ncbi:MAG: hypothetical protein ABJF10_26360 [Chthoniobacter sp.]|uniref:hypothetical protein n=1 Tax=Chthoniobacter sp. TaxID=2510640 RepID=UPI0032A2964D